MYSYKPSGHETETRNLSRQLERLLPTTRPSKTKQKYTSPPTYAISPYLTKEVGGVQNPVSFPFGCPLYRTLSEGFQSLFQLGQLQNRHNGKDFPVTHLRNILITRQELYVGPIGL